MINAKASTEFYICDLRPEFSGDRYITFWRPNNSNYAFPLPWAGKYKRETILEQPRYYFVSQSDVIIRFPVPCSAADALGVAPEPGMIDGDAGPVVRNTPSNRDKLRAAMFVPQFALAAEEARKAVKR